MKPTPEQLDFLKKYLQQNLEFRETYVEFYDHILTALENEADDVPFEQSVQNIIQNDFGGVEGITRIERNFKINATRELRRKYANYLVGYFKPPMIAVTTMLGLLFYVMAIQTWFGFWQFMIAILVMRLSTSVLRGVRHIRSGYTFRSNLSSVKDFVFIWLDRGPAMVFILALIANSFGHVSPVAWFKQVHPVIPVIFLTSMALHVMAYYKIYKEEFKAVLT